MLVRDGGRCGAPRLQSHFTQIQNTLEVSVHRPLTLFTHSWSQLNSSPAIRARCVRDAIANETNRTATDLGFHFRFRFRS